MSKEEDYTKLLEQIEQEKVDITEIKELIQNLQNKTISSEDFDEFQRKNLDFALKSNDNIYSRLTEIQENTKAFTKIEGIEKIEEELGKVNEKLVTRIQEILREHTSGEGGGATLPAETLEIQYKSIRQTYKYVKELKESFDATNNKEISEKLSKVDEIYENMLTIETWTKEMNILNSTFENMLSKLSRNINFDSITERLDLLSDDIANLTDSSDKIDYISKQLDKIQKQSLDGSLSDESAEKISSMIAKIKESTGASLKDMPEFDDLCSKVDIVYESLSALNLWAAKLDVIQEKLDDIKSQEHHAAVDNLPITASDIDVEEIKKSNTQVEEKINTISESIRSIADRLTEIKSGEQHSIQNDRHFEDTDNKFTQKIEEISRSLDDFNEKINRISLASNVTDELNDNIRIVNTEIAPKVQSISTILETLNRQISNMNVEDPLGNEINERIEDLSNEITQKFDDIQAFVQSNNTDITYQVKAEFKDFVESLNSDITNKLDNIQEYIPSDNNDLIIQVKEQIDVLVNELSEHLSVLSNDLKPELNNVIESITNNLSMKIADVASERNNSIESIILSVDEIKDNLTKHDFVSQMSGTLNDKFEEISSVINSNIKTINESFADINELLTDNLAGNKEILDAVGDLSTKAESSCDNMTFLQEEIRNISQEIEGISEHFKNNDFSFTDFRDEIKSSFESELTEFTNTLTLFEDKLTQNSKNLSKQISGITKNISSLSDSVGQVNEKIETSTLSLSNISESIKAESISSDRHFDNLKSDINEIKKIHEENSDDIKYVINEVGNNAMNIVDVKEQLDDLSKEFVNLTGTNDKKANNYVYTLFDVESDLIKIHKILSQTTQFTDENIGRINNNIDSITNDISSISKRTNKLIVNSDDANKKFRNHLEDLANAIRELKNTRASLEETLQTAELENKITSLTDSTERTNDALSYITKWVDTVDDTLSIIKSNQTGYSEATRNKVQEYCNNIIDKLSDTENLIYRYYSDILKEISDSRKNRETNYNDILAKLAELKSKHNSVLDLLLSNDDYYKNFTEQFTNVINKLQEVEDKNSDNYKMLLNSEKVFIKIFDRLEYLDDKTYLTKIIKKIENFEDKTVLIKLLKKIEKINKTHSQKVIKQIQDMPDADTISVKTLEILSPIFEELLKTVQKQDKNTSDILEKYNTRLIEQAKIMDNLNAKLNEQNNIAQDFESKLSEQNKLFDKFDNKLSVQNKSALELKEIYAQKLAEQNEIIIAQNERIAKLENILDSINSKINRFDENISKLVNYIEE